MKIDLNRLRIFNHVYLSGSVSKAARELNLSQPAVSQHLKKLEKELKIPLFTRVSKRIIPTPAARRLHEKMAPFLTDIQKEVRFLRRPLDTPYGLLRIGTPALFGAIHLPVICNLFRFRFPTVTFSLEFGDTDRLLDSLSRGLIDMAIIDRKSTTPGSTATSLFRISKPLVEETMYLSCSRPYFLRNRSATEDYARLIKLDFLAPTGDEHLLRRWFQHHFKRTPYELDVVLTTESHQAVITALKSGMGLGLLPGYLLHKEVEAGELVILQQNSSQLSNTLSLACLKNREQTLTEKAFISIMKKELEQSGLSCPASQPGT